MKNHEALKYLHDLDLIQGKLADLQAINKVLLSENDAMKAKLVSLSSQLEAFTSKSLKDTQCSL